jgi:hypothetical protein
MIHTEIWYECYDSYDMCHPTFLYVVFVKYLKILVIEENVILTTELSLSDLGSGHGLASNFPASHYYLYM